MRRFTILMATAALVLAATPSIAAAGGNGLRATFEGPTVGAIFDPDVVAQECPDGYEWIIKLAGGVELPGLGMVPGGAYLRTPVYEGEVGFYGQHCSRWFQNPMLSDRTSGKFVGGNAAGMLTLVTPAGDELSMSYQGRFIFEGDIAAMDWISQARWSYRIVGGTGVFADAAGGSGSIKAVDDSGWGSGRIVGSYQEG